VKSQPASAVRLRPLW